MLRKNTNQLFINLKTNFSLNCYVIAIVFLFIILIPAKGISGGYADDFRRLHPEVIKAIQNTLKEKHRYNPGPSDGIYGTKTRNAINSFCLDHNVESNGRLHPDLIKALWGFKFDYHSAVVNGNSQEILEFYDKLGIKQF